MNIHVWREMTTRKKEREKEREKKRKKIGRSRSSNA
jgi:hypothetical protein